MTEVRLVTYNILSDQLCQPDHFVTCNVEDLNPKKRFERIRRQLEKEIRAKSIICLQEVSMNFECELQTFFCKHNYYFVTALYGTFLDGFMGVGLAWSMDEFELVSCDMCRLIDTKKWSFPWHLFYFKEKMVSWGMGKLSSFLPSQQRKSFLHKFTSSWDRAQNRQNRIIVAQLRSKATNKTFFVATYHMPCAYKEPQILWIHSALALSYVQNIASNHPFIFAGDFNMTPDSSVYNWYLTSELSQYDFAFPPPRRYDPWTPVLPQGPVRSAYGSFQNCEPSFTNFSQVRNGHQFAGTLDYIFISSHWTVKGVKSLPKTINTLKGPLPSGEEPSDHLLIAADLIF